MKNRHSLKLLKTAYQPDQLPSGKAPTVLFLGRSNVGKSSLINALSGQGLAQISKNPGKTRSINIFQWGKKMQWVDLPGYGYAKRSKQERNEWRALVEAFFNQMPPLGLAFILMDSRRPLEEEEFELIKALEERKTHVFLLLTKADQLKQSDRHQCIRRLKQQINERKLENLLTYALVSVKTQEGLPWIHRLLSRYEKDIHLTPNAMEGLEASPGN
ncbi:MAG: ribosome biogenesis GTP-binding protein YihA/YsxC [bacterium]|nr:ribosome biogenesis GTP-binding protein YihA/YsxC [bacterium]